MSPIETVAVIAVFLAFIGLLWTLFNGLLDQLK